MPYLAISSVASGLMAGLVSLRSARVMWRSLLVMRGWKAPADITRECITRVSVVMGRNALDDFGQQITWCRTANVTQTEDADHPLVLVDHG
jgi:hypothetical protein